MGRRRSIVLISILFLSFPIYTLAETVILKSGKTLEGKITDKTDKYIKIDVEGVLLTYYFNEIESIDWNRIGGNNGKEKIISSKDLDSLLDECEALVNKYSALKKDNSADYQQKIMQFQIDLGAWTEKWKQMSGQITDSKEIQRLQGRLNIINEKVHKIFQQ